MNRFAIPIVAVAFLTAACGGAGTLSSSKAQPVTVAGAAQINGGTNAGSDISDVNRTNPQVHKAGTSQPKPAATPQTVAPAAGQPSFGTATDRCSGGGIGTGVAGSRSGTAGSGKRPLPMCPVE
jgi:hypothetical protein